MKPRVEALHLNFQTKTATAVVVVPTPTRDAKGDYPPVFDHLELFVEMWCGLQGESLSLKYDAEGYPCIYHMSTDRAGKAYRLEVRFALSVPSTRITVDQVDWKELHGTTSSA